MKYIQASSYPTMRQDEWSKPKLTERTNEAKTRNSIVSIKKSRQWGSNNGFYCSIECPTIETINLGPRREAQQFETSLFTVDKVLL